MQETQTVPVQMTTSLRLSERIVDRIEAVACDVLTPLKAPQLLKNYSRS